MDPSQSYRPEEKYNEYNEFHKLPVVSRTDKNETEFRNYDLNLQTAVIRNTYKKMHATQTVDYVKNRVSCAVGLCCPYFFELPSYFLLVFTSH